MSNHYHVVLCVDEKQAKAWDNREVLRRWSELYSLSYLTDKYYRKESISKAELDAIYVEIEVYRDRLMDVSWFMRGINESTARRANAEDNCTGRFYDLLPYKSCFALPAAFKFDPVKFSGRGALKAKHC